MDSYDLLTLAVPGLPLAAVIANGLFGKWLKAATGPIACAAMLGTALASILLWLRLAGGGDAVHIELFRWIAVGDLHVAWAFAVDPLASVMLLVVSIVGSLVFIYAIGYMHGDPGYARFFTYLPLFAFSMYILVLGDSFLTLFVGWEGVGLCSYLLIGFWYTKMFSETMSNADAGRKAFIVNRIGDFGFLLGMLLVFWCFGSLSFGEVFPKAKQLFEHAPDSGWMIAISLLLFVGATGKSAQIPLYIWLPDAMAGPTPVSALIHAATMVTAGVYMLARCSQFFVLAPTAMLVVAIVGAATAFLAATIGLTQRDIKKVLAYSTVSQLGYMFLACGAGAFAGGIFHVFTHAFFKGCLFLCAGSVIHVLHHEQDMFKMGGLAKYMPRTRWTYLISCLAIAGIFPFAGFFSKDAILEHAYAKFRLDGDAAYLVLWVIGVATAFLTAVYMFRSYWMTFHGECRVEEEKRRHLHESPAVMTVPLILLAAGATLGGLVGIPFKPEWNLFGRFLEPSLASVHHAGGEAHLSGFEIAGLTLLSLAVALVGIGLAYLIYSRNWPEMARAWARKAGPLFDLSFHKWWVDELYGLTVVRGLLGLSRLCLGNDAYVVDGAVHATAHASRAAGLALKLLQNGRVQGYAIVMLIAAVLITLLLIVSQLPATV